MNAAPTKDPAPGQLLLILHGHLPFVRNPDHERFLEEDWLFEAITECYLPLLSLCQRLADEGVDYRLTIGLSPTLLSMLTDDLLRQRYMRHLDAMCDLCDREVQRTRTDAGVHGLARMYRARFENARARYAAGFDPVSAFAALADRGLVELLTCAATHAFLPLLQPFPQAIRAQLRTAVNLHRRLLGRNPAGIWLPECGYFPGLEDHLAEAGLGFFFLENHGLLGARPPPLFGVYAPVLCSNGVAAFGRDPHTSRIVWSAREGYPGDPEYRDFYRDIGHDLDLEYLGPFLQATGDRKGLGIKYHRITGPGQDKQVYRPAAAARRVQAHACDFVDRQALRLRQLRARMGDRPALIVAPFDAELFGHWWFEGPQFLEAMLRRTAARPDQLSCTTPSGFLARAPQCQVVQPAASSWGQGGYSQVWMNASNDWMIPPLHRASSEMIRLAEGNSAAQGLLRRSLNQAARELMLAQASDWPFMISTGNAVDYARRRFEEHLQNFTILTRSIQASRPERRVLSRLEAHNNLFPEVDFRLFAGV